MKFTVVWTDSAEQDLAQFWLGARNRISIDEATQRIEAELATNPLHAGESRVGNVRVLTIEPLTVVFSVRPADRLVKVVQVTYHTTLRRR